MPGLVLFNRRWHISGDDLVFPGLLEIFTRLAWLIAIIVVFNHHKEAFSCNDGHLLWTYYIGVITLLSISIVLTIGIISISMKGSITNTFPRRKLPYFLYLKVLLGMPELIWNVLGTFWAFGKSTGCDYMLVLTVKGAVICGWCICIVISFGIVLLFDPIGYGHTRRYPSAKVWEGRCNVICCCSQNNPESKRALNDVAKLFATIFQDLDLVPTDIAAGLLLLQRRQTQRKHLVVSRPSQPSKSRKSREAVNRETGRILVSGEGSESSESSPTHASSINDGGCPESMSSSTVLPKGWMHLGAIKYYMKFAMAMYGWPLYLFINTCTGGLRLCPFYRCCAHCSKAAEEEHVTGDNCCLCNLAAVKKFIEFTDAEIIHVSFRDEIFQPPFFVSVDHKNTAVVIAVRGTLSFQDALTDLTANTEKMFDSGDPEFCCHKGILQAARYIRDELEFHSLIERGFQKTGNQKIVVTGHSLGAGTAAILAILLKEKYNDVYCFAYAPPGGLLCRPASDYSQEFTCSVVLGDDLIPRLGLCNIEKLKTDVVGAVNACDLPKYKIFLSGFWKVVCGLNINHREEDFNVDEPQHNLVDVSSSSSSGHYGSIGDSVTPEKQLYPPGLILHIVEEQGSTGFFSKPTYHIEWTRPNEYTEIRVSSKMLLDHLPNSLDDALERLNVPYEEFAAQV
ncbi:diacylglycerol lipase-beta [Octopus sinensis]|uniref:sn-1-specific diacylglycerol lipase n=1 Tax=Octopus sinensis TaxID=2607531 RepID=A0A6P7S4Z3_9MOLL|nr:diacylglycerol lipase-beta [Octopus sinensis]